MPWNPDKYNEFRNIRYQPFFDLMEQISGDGLETAVDLGCGTGEQTRILSGRFPGAVFTGIDSSAEMLAKSGEIKGGNISFRQASVGEFIREQPAASLDLVFSNAALQWSDDHEGLFPRLIGLLRNNGQFAVQMPSQKENRLNQLLLQLVQEEPFAGYLGGWKRDTPMLDIDSYVEVMFGNGLEQVQVMQKVYPIIAETAGTLFDFIAGSALVPYMEKLSGSEQELLTAEFKSRINRSFRKFPAVYPFKRLLLYGRKKSA
ncbi:MAG: methyltransferase domain-containing protein [Chitinophagaceae bacterium]|nr:MAG: methyltransferase domain-containing protein [Chitinophagaceae bacterium]